MLYTALYSVCYMTVRLSVKGFKAAEHTKESEREENRHVRGGIISK